MMPSSTDLSYFLEAANTQNLSRAAERLGISQPSLSLAIQRLESELGVAVLVRSKRGVRLTQAGEQLLLHTRQLLQTWEQVKQQALASTHEIQGSYTIGCHASVALYSLAGFLPDLLQKHPRLQVHLRHDLSRKIVEEVISSTIDIGIVVNPVRHPDLIIHKLCDDEVSLWQAASMQRRADKGHSMEAVLLGDLDLMQSQAIIKQLGGRNWNFSRILSSSSLEVIADLTASGCGIGILPSRAAALAKSKLKRVPNAPVFKDEICLVFRVENKQVKTVQKIVACVRESFRNQ